MDENGLAGISRDLGDKVQAGVGRATSSVRAQAEGVPSQLAGAAQDVYGQATDATRSGAKLN